MLLPWKDLLQLLVLSSPTDLSSGSSRLPVDTRKKFLRRLQGQATSPNSLHLWPPAAPFPYSQCCAADVEMGPLHRWAGSLCFLFLITTISLALKTWGFFQAASSLNGLGTRHQPPCSPEGEGLQRSSFPATAFTGRVTLHLMLLLCPRVLLRAWQQHALCITLPAWGTKSTDTRKPLQHQGNWLFPTWLTHPFLGFALLLSRLLLIKHLSEGISKTAGLWPFMPPITSLQPRN